MRLNIERFISESQRIRYELVNCGCTLRNMNSNSQAFKEAAMHWDALMDELASLNSFATTEGA